MSVLLTSKHWLWAVLWPPGCYSQQCNWTRWCWQQSRLLSIPDLENFLGRLIQHHFMAVSVNVLFSIKRLHLQKIVPGFIVVSNLKNILSPILQTKDMGSTISEIRDLHVGCRMREHKDLQYWEINPHLSFYFFRARIQLWLLTQLWWPFGYSTHSAITSLGVGLAENKVAVSRVPHGFTHRSASCQL